MTRLLRKLNPVRLARRLDHLRREALAARLPLDRVRAETVGVAVAVRNRGGARVDNFLATLRAQTLPPECVDITVCDFGSEPAALDELRELCDRHDARLVPTGDSSPAWNKSLALNIALRHSAPRARWLLPTDIDMLFAPNFIETVIRAHLAFGSAIVLAQFRDLPPELDIGGIDPVADFARLTAASEWVGEHATGPCLSTSREWCFRVHGFDERMTLWGYMDQDYSTRALRDGLREVWIHERTTLLHQWHPRKFEVFRGDPEQQRVMREHYEANRRLYETDTSIVRNPESWGGLPS